MISNKHFTYSLENDTVMKKKHPKKGKRKKTISYSFLLRFINTLKRRAMYTITAVVSIIIAYINYHRQPNLPLFPLFWALFFCILMLSFYSIKMNEQNNKKLDQKMIADGLLVRKKLKNRNAYSSNFNLIFHILSFYVFLLPICYNKPIDNWVLWSCFIALFFIVNMSIMGYIQYIYFIRFIHSIKIEREPIYVFNRDNPNDTDWLVLIAQNVQKYNVMFFIVGMCYIILFYIFSFSGMYIEVNSILQFLIIQIAWGILVVGIIVAYPISSVLVIKDIKCISLKLKQQQLLKLEKRRSIIKDESIRNSYTSIILLLKQMPEYPIKVYVSSIFTTCIEVVNIFAAVTSIEPIYNWAMKLI